MRPTQARGGTATTDASRPGVERTTPGLWNVTGSYDGYIIEVEGARAAPARGAEMPTPDAFREDHFTDEVDPVSDYDPADDAEPAGDEDELEEGEEDRDEWPPDPFVWEGWGE